MHAAHYLSLSIRTKLFCLSRLRTFWRFFLKYYSLPLLVISFKSYKLDNSYNSSTVNVLANHSTTPIISVLEILSKEVLESIALDKMSTKSTCISMSMYYRAVFFTCCVVSPVIGVPIFWTPVEDGQGSMSLAL